MNLPVMAGSLSSLAAEYGAPLANHLWQSTGFAGMVWLLTFLLRKNRAQTRYCLWLAASAKFLLPFSLLVGLGSHLQWSRTPAVTQPKLFVAMEAIGHPFSLPNPPPVPITAPPGMLEAVLRNLPVFLLMVWFAGGVAVLLMWFLRWRRLTAARRATLPSKSGREFEALRRMELRMRSPRQISLVLSQSTLEPGILGVFRPLLVLPAGISERLTDAQLESVITHELCHVRRRDNLAAALHMLVEALFWFHPLVWWMGARLVDERERACDEEVLSLGADPQVYAESILKVCKFYVESPLACVSGVTGAELKKRMAYIMTKNLSRKLDFSRKLLLSIAGVLAVAAPITFGLLHSPQSRAELRASNAPITPAFEVASVQPSRPGDGNTGVRIAPGRITLANWTVKGLLVYAYNLEPVGGPGWVDSKRYDIDVRVNDALAYKSGRLIETNVAGRFPPGLRHDQLKLMVQSLLADEFKLRLSRETRQVPVYALVIAKGGPKLHEAKVGDTYADGIVGLDGLTVGPNRGTGQDGRLTAQALPIPTVAEVLTKILGRTVLDETGLTGEYDFTLEWTPIKSHAAAEEQQGTGSASPESVGPSIFRAIQEQLGLKLESRETTVDVLVIDHADKPAESQAQNSAALRPLSRPPMRTRVVNATRGRTALQTQDTGAIPPTFELVSIKPHTSGNDLFKMMFEQDGFTAINVTLRNLLRAAYGAEESRIFGGPNWFNSEKYDVEARMDSAVAKELAGMSQDQLSVERQRMLQALLVDRFKLTLHRQTTQLGGYVLVVAKNGPKLQEAKPGDTYRNGLKNPEGGSPAGMFRLGRFHGGRGELVGQGLSMAKLVRLLSEDILNRHVIDNTGLTGNYDFTLEWKIGDESQGPMFQAAGDHQKVLGSTSPPGFSGSSFFTAIQEQLGLELDSGDSPIAVIFIDHAERVTGNEQPSAAHLN